MLLDIVFSVSGRCDCKLPAKIVLASHLLIVDGNREFLFIDFWRTNAFCLPLVRPQRCPSCRRSVQQIVRSDARRSVRKVFFNLCEWLDIPEHDWRGVGSGQSRRPYNQASA